MEIPRIISSRLGSAIAQIRTRLQQLSELPITWLSNGRLKSSLILRHSAADSGRIQEILATLTQEKFSAAHAGTSFPSAREPDKGTLAKASEDYMRCILAKSVAAAFQKATPKYRNEAARKQFVTRMVEIIEGCHLSETFVRLKEAEASAEPDRVLTGVRKEMEGLVAEKTDLAAEHANKLDIARHEFMAYLENLQKVIGVSFEDSERYQKRLSVTSFFPPALFENENTWRWGSLWYPELGVLNISPPMLFIDTIRKGVLAREAAVLLSPRNLDTMEYAPRILCEQSEYFAYKMLDRKIEKEFWAQARHGLRQSSKVAAGELVDFFEYYEMMVGPTLYQGVVKTTGSRKCSTECVRLLHHFQHSRSPPNTNEIQSWRNGAFEPSVKETRHQARRGCSHAPD